MTLQDLGSIGEFIGALIVMVSLLYLAVQIRQNTRSLRASSYQEVVRAANDWSGRLIEDPDAGTVLLQGLTDRDSLEDAQRVQFDHLILSFLRNYATAAYLARNGLIPIDICEAYATTARRYFGSNSMRDWLDRNEALLEKGFRAEIQRVLAA